MAMHSHPPDLQNSYGLEMATTSAYHGSDGPQAVPVGGLEASPGQHAAAPVYSNYAQQAQKNNDLESSSATAPNNEKPRNRILGLPLWGIWLLLGLAIVVLGVALGVGLGVGLSQRNSTSSGSSNASAAPSSSSSSSTSTSLLLSSSAATTATPTSSGGSTTTPSTTTSSSTAAATTDANVEICQNAYLDSCTTISVPASSCIDFASAYNDSLSSLSTGGPTCLFYTGSSCTGDYWSTSGSQDLIPGAFNDAFSSVTCD